LGVIKPDISAAQVLTQVNNAYVNKIDSVFLVNQSVLLDAEKVKNKELFDKLEKALDKKVLNQYFPIINGTGFFITTDGYLITAFHVVKYITNEQKNQYALYSFTSFLSKYLVPGYFTKSELHTIIQEYVHIVKNSKVVITLKSQNKEEYVATLIDKNDDLDLALLKTETNKDNKSIIINSTTDLKISDSVITIGYPLQFILDQFLKDFKATITDGMVSAIRDDKWDIQHTAAINSGNSGGPLLTKNGDLIGINLGKVQNADGMYFAISCGKLVKWLKDIGKEDILQKNK
jgi:S1-C subfamily serine protease